MYRLLLSSRYVISTRVHHGFNAIIKKIALLKVNNEILNKNDKRKKSMLLFVLMTAAFDTG